MRDELTLQPDFDIYGPVGLRHFIRTTLTHCQVNLSGVYAVHELIDSKNEPSAACGEDDLLINEGVGADIRCSKDGVWEKILAEGNGKGGKGWSVSAGPIEHRGASVIETSRRCIA